MIDDDAPDAPAPDDDEIPEHCDDLTPRERGVAAVVVTFCGEKLRTVVIAVALALVLSISGNVLGWVLTGNESENRAAAIRAEGERRADAIRAEGVRRDLAIDASRLTLLVDSCRTTNRRHKATIDALRALLPMHPTPTERRGAKGAEIIVGALVPFVADCEGVSRRRLAKSKSAGMP